MLLFKAKMKYREHLFIKKLYCCGCFFDKVCYILNSKDLIEYNNFEKDFIEVKGYFKDFISGTVAIVCDDILFSMFEKGQLFSNFHICSAVRESKSLYEFKLK